MINYGNLIIVQYENVPNKRVLTMYCIRNVYFQYNNLVSIGSQFFRDLITNFFLQAIHMQNI